MRGTMSTCFVCLNDTTNRVCTTCQCYAHLSCWGKYLQSKDESIIVFTPNNVELLIKITHNCPICKTILLDSPRITRNRTKQYRDNVSVLNIINSIVYADQNGITPYEKSERYHVLMKTFKTNKEFICKDKTIKKYIQQQLYKLYHIEQWKPANHYHMELFGRQISTQNGYDSGDESD